MTSESPAAARVWPWAGLLARLLLAAVWVAAGLLKLPDPAESVRAVRAYRLLPEAVVPAVGYGLPVLEVAVGLLLAVGLAVRLAAVVSAALLVAFLVGIASAWARGLQIDCGCFGGGGKVAAGDTRYLQELARDTGLLVVALALARRPRTRLSLAAALGPAPGPRAPAPADPHETADPYETADPRETTDPHETAEPYESTGPYETAPRSQQR